MSDVELVPGRIVTASILNNLENPRSALKARPVILLRRSNGTWDAMGITGLAKYADGRDRVAIENWRAIGLRAQSYLWGRRLVSVAVNDIAMTVGWVDQQVADAINSLVPLPTETALELDQVAQQHHTGS